MQSVPDWSLSCEQLEVEQQHEPKPLSKQAQWRRRANPDPSAVFSKIISDAYF